MIVQEASIRRGGIGGGGVGAGGIGTGGIGAGGIGAVVPLLELETLVTLASKLLRNEVAILWTLQENRSSGSFPEQACMKSSRNISS